MSITADLPTSGFPQGSDRLTSTHIKGITVALPCFAWCRESHHEQDHFHVEDFTHVGEAVEVTLSSGEELFSARLISFPHCEVGTKVAVDFDGESAEYNATQVEALADQLISAASQLRGLARQIGGVR